MKPVIESNGGGVMAASRKRGTGISIIGFVFAMSGLVLAIAANVVVGIAIAGLEIVFIVVGRATSRKGTPP